MMRLQNARILGPSSLDPANEPIAFDAISDALGAIRGSVLSWWTTNNGRTKAI